MHILFRMVLNKEGRDQLDVPPAGVGETLQVLPGINRKIPLGGGIIRSTCVASENGTPTIPETNVRKILLRMIPNF